MGVREKLVELLCNLPTPEFVIGTRRAGKKLITAGFIADHLIANGVTVQEWISVKDRLPEEGDIVLCYMEFGEQRIAQWDESENCWAGQLIDYHKEQVTHWMPLPQPPKGE